MGNCLTMRDVIYQRTTKNMNRLLVFIGLLAMAVASCTPYRIVRNKADHSATWTEYRTFAFIDTSRVNAIPGSQYMAAMNQIKKAVASELQSRGYQQTNDNPDLLINLGTVVQEKTQTRQTTIQEAPLYIGQRRYSWRSQEVPVGTYQEGTLNIHIVDAHRNALIWDAAISGVLPKKGVNQENVSEAVGQLFRKLPEANS